SSLTTTGSSTHGTLYELDAIAAVIIGGTLLSGGRGTLIGSILGVLVFTTITNLFVLNNLATEVQNIAKGVIIVAAVLIQGRARQRGVRARGDHRLLRARGRPRLDRRDRQQRQGPGRPVPRRHVRGGQPDQRHHPADCRRRDADQQEGQRARAPAERRQPVDL